MIKTLYRSYKQLRSRIENEPAKSVYVDSALFPAMEGEAQPPQQLLRFKKDTVTQQKPHVW